MLVHPLSMDCAEYCIVTKNAILSVEARAHGLKTEIKEINKLNGWSVEPRENKRREENPRLGGSLVVRNLSADGDLVITETNNKHTLIKWPAARQ